MTITALVMFNMPATSRDRFVADWESVTPTVVSGDGFIEGRFLETRSENRMFRFVNVPTWESEEALTKGRKLAEDEDEGGARCRLMEAWRSSTSP